MRTRRDGRYNSSSVLNLPKPTLSPLAISTAASSAAAVAKMYSADAGVDVMLSFAGPAAPRHAKLGSTS